MREGPQSVSFLTFKFTRCHSYPLTDDRFYNSHGCLAKVIKYARLAHPEIKGIHELKRIKQLDQSKHEEIQYWYSPKWDINHLIPRS